MRAYERLLRYAQFDTASCESSDSCPSTPGQLVLARALRDEMLEMGLSNVRLDEHGYLYAEIPANAEGFPAIGLIAHMDTVDCVPVVPMNVRIVENYDGGDVLLAGGETLSPRDYPELAARAGKDLIVTDGKTLLGADDKAGVAEILTACESILAGDRPHGRILVGFTPDEEIGRGAKRFRIPELGADFGYTVDGGTLGEIEFENFNAAAAHVEFQGRSIHPGSAKDKMLNAATLAMEFHAMLPVRETPENTENREGFFMLSDIHGCVDHAASDYIVRDHDKTKFEQKKARLEKIAAYLNEKYGDGCVKLTVKDSYYNMLEKLKDHMDVVERARDAMLAVGETPVYVPIRGGTDGATISYMGMPCPNLPTGGANFHGVYEYVAVQSLERMVDVLEAIVVGKK